MDKRSLEEQNLRWWEELESSEGYRLRDNGGKRLLKEVFDGGDK